MWEKAQFPLSVLLVSKEHMFCRGLYYLKIKMLLIKLTARLVTATDVGSDSAPPHPSPQPVNKRTRGGKAGSVFEQTPLVSNLNTLSCHFVTETSLSALRGVVTAFIVQ